MNVIKQITNDNIVKKGLASEMTGNSEMLYFNINNGDSKYCIKHKRSFNMYMLGAAENKQMNSKEYQRLFSDENKTIYHILDRIDFYCIIDDKKLLKDL